MPRESHRLTVLDKTRLTPNMLRITLGGDALSDFPADSEGDYVKLVFAADMLPEGITGGKKQLMRSYTVRAFDRAASSLTLDFVDHGDNGPASAWGVNCQPGDAIDIRWPGPVKKVDNDADWFFLAADMTALPALSVNLEQMPADAHGYAVIEVISEADIQSLDAPAGVDIDWVINAHPDQENCLLADAVRAKDWKEGRVSVWLAAEFAAMKAIRGYFHNSRQVPHTDMYASSYWKMGDTDEGNKMAKKRLAEAEAAQG